jgi:hypothetical protein
MFTGNRAKLFFIVASLLVLTVQQSQAQPALGDYDNDGKSDLAVALVNRQARTTAWLVRRASGEAPFFWNFGVPGDALVTGKFFGDGRVYPGVVFVRDARIPLEWYIKNPAGQDVFLNYGIPGDTIPNLGDLDCDGITDLVAIRNGTSRYYPGYRIWYVALSGSGGRIVESLFGLVTDRVAVADIDGDNCAEMVALRDGFTWYTKKLFSPEIGVVQWGLPGDIPLLPQDMNRDGRPDYIISRPTGAGQVAYIRYSAASYQTVNLGQDTSVPMVGKFGSSNGFAWSQRDTGFTAISADWRNLEIFLFGIAANAMIRPDGTVIQPDDSARFGSVANPTNPDPFVGPMTCDYTLECPDERFTGNRVNANNSRHALKIVFDNDWAGQIEDVKAFINGQLFDDFHSMGYEGGGRPWWNSDKSITSYSADQPVTIVAYLYDGKQACLYVENPRVSID